MFKYSDVVVDGFFEVGDEDVLIRTMGYQDRSRTIKNLVWYVLQLRSIASERYRLGIKTLEGLEPCRAVASQILD